MINQFTTVAYFVLPHEAAVPCALLESEGIACFLRNESTIQSYNFYSNAIGGVQLQVKTEDAERALEILRIGGFLGKNPTQESEKAALAEKHDEPWMYDENDQRIEPVTNSQAEQEREKKDYSRIIIAIIVIAIAAAAIYWLKRENEPAEPEKPDFTAELTRFHWNTTEIIGANFSNDHSIKITLVLPGNSSLPKKRVINPVSIPRIDWTFETDRSLVYAQTDSLPKAARWKINEDSISFKGFPGPQSELNGAYHLTQINQYNILLESASNSISFFLVRNK
jgi:hypothetical protein